MGRAAREVLNSHKLHKFDSRTITTSNGAPLPVAIKNPLSRSFSIDLTPIRVHTDAHAQLTVRKLNTRAFTYANHIFLGSGESPSDLRLMAHEVAHVVQQSRGAVLQHFTTTHGDALEHEAERASAAVMRGHTFNVQQRATPRPQGLFGLSLPNPLTWLANRVNSIPGFRMLTIIIGMNPVNGAAVPRTAANILRAMVEFIPGGELITQALDNYGIFDRAGRFVEEQIGSLGMTAGLIRNAVTEFISSLSPGDILHLGGVWDRAVRIFTSPIDRIISLGRRLVGGIVGLIKDAILLPLARLASQTRGWNLLIAVLGRNPITGEEVPRNAETLIGGFMQLIGQEEVWTNLQRSRAVPRAWAWFQGALSGLLNFVSQIPTLFVQALRSLELMDIVLLPRAFVRVGSVFGNFVGQFITWAGEQVFSLLQIIFEVLAPLAMPYIRRASSALRTIFRDPIGFIGNLVRAGIQGFRQFGSNFLTHLRASLIGWLTGAMSGANIYIPQGFNFREIVKFVLSVLGLTWQNIRTKLVRAIGETAVRALETGFQIVVTLVTQGPAAAWEQIQQGISNLREMVMEQVMTFVRDRIVQAAITRLITSLNPAGAFIQAVIAIYNTVMFFIERLRQITQVAMSFIDSMAAIASGNITAAANRVEQTMAGLLTLVISFLARLVGLGRVSDAVVRVIDRVRAPIDRALDRVVEWIVTQARRFGRAVAQVGVPQDPNERLRLAARTAVAAARGLGGRLTRPLLTPLFAAIRVRYGLTEIEPYEREGRWRVRIVINPRIDQEVPSSAILNFINQQVVLPVRGGPATLLVPDVARVRGYQLRLGSQQEGASIRRVRAPEGEGPLPDVYIDAQGFLRAGQREGQRDSTEADKFLRLRALANTLGYNDLLPNLNESNASRTNNSTFRGELRTRIVYDQRYSTLAGINRIINSDLLTGESMQGALFEDWVVAQFGRAHNVIDGHVSYKLASGNTGRMDRFSGNDTIIEAKSRRRPSGVDAAIRDQDVPATMFELADRDETEFTAYSELVSSNIQGFIKTGRDTYRTIGPFRRAIYYFNVLGVGRLFRNRMPGALKRRTETYVGAYRLEDD
jgi:uncharacterized protein DUF4157